MIYLPEKGIAFPDDPKLEIISQLQADDLGKNGKPLSYVEVYRKKHDCDDKRCQQDIFRLVWHNDQIHEITDWDERDVIDTISVLSQALSIEAQRKNIN